MKTLQIIIMLGLAILFTNKSSYGQGESWNLSANSNESHNKWSLVTKLPTGFTVQTNSSKQNLNEQVKVDVILIDTSSFNSQFTGMPLSDSKINMALSSDHKGGFLSNRRNKYASLWAYASLNYLYADLVGLMDANVLAQYQTGVVEGMKITPEFLTAAAGFMQIPIANVFLPYVIKDDKTLRWVQIASGGIMTLVQAGTLFVGKPTPYYALFSAFEITATSFITIDAIKWKPNKVTNSTPNW